MKTNYQIIEHQIRKYSFQYLHVSNVALEMLEKLHYNNPPMIENDKHGKNIFQKSKVLNGLTSRALGIAFLIYSSAEIYKNSNLSNEQKIQQISITLMSYFLSNYLVCSLAIFGAGLFGALLGAIIAGVVTIIAISIVNNYTLVNRKEKYSYA